MNFRAIGMGAYGYSQKNMLILLYVTEFKNFDFENFQNFAIILAKSKF